MGADTRYSVSLFIQFFYFLCHYLGAYQIDVSSMMVAIASSMMEDWKLP